MVRGLEHCIFSCDVLVDIRVWRFYVFMDLSQR